MSRQDRQGVRTPAALEQKYNFDKRFDAAMDAAAEAGEATRRLDNKLTQTEVFNRLTNYGKSQGVYIGDDGQLYINASYLATGILKSRDNKTFYLDLDKGILKGRFSEISIAGKTVSDIAGEKADKAQHNAEKHADEAAKGAVEAQTQADVFNKLTNSGESQGIFIQDGLLYINASYLIAGILQSLDGTTFFLDLANGILKGNFEELSIGGIKASWKENSDGTYTLVGESGG